MCLRFVHKGNDVITGFNFDIDLAVWDHKIILTSDKFCIGIKVNGVYHTFHGANANGNVSTLLYVHECEEGKYKRSPSCYRVDLFSENFIKNKMNFDEAVNIAKEKRFVNVPNCSMQAMLSERNGRVLVVEPGVGYREENSNYALITNYSILNPELAKTFITEGDNRYERAKDILEKTDNNFNVENAFELLKLTSVEGLWATRVSFVYSANENAIYYVLNNDFSNIRKHALKV